MPGALEYIVTGALTRCDKGSGFMPLTATSNTTVHIQKILVATETDKAPLVNIPSYGMCLITKAPCSPAPTLWLQPYNYVKVKGAHPLIFRSCHMCALGGKIEFITSGQIPVEQALTPESLASVNEANKQSNDAVEEYEAEKDSVGEAGFVEGFIPIWGSGRDAIHSFQTGHWGWGLFNTAMVVVDVFTLGSSSIVKGAVEGGVKGALRAGEKAMAKKMIAALAAKEAAAALFKKGAGHITEASIKYLGLCITNACFAAGTPVATGNGLKAIEDIVCGDEVWAYNEQTGETGLKTVLNAFERETDAIVVLTIGGEELETTPEHPFYADGRWKEAGSLEVGDTIQLLNGKAALVENVVYKFDKELQPEMAGYEEAAAEDYQLTRVFNIEVDGWNTYFVGLLGLLVHNVACIYQLARDGVVWAQNMVRGIELNKLMRAEMFAKAEKKGIKYLDEVVVKGKDGKIFGRADGYIPKAAIIERKATDLSTITDETAKSYINQLGGYENKTVARTGEKMEGKKFLQVTNKEGASQAILDYAASKKVQIVTSTEEIFTAIGK